MHPRAARRQNAGAPAAQRRRDLAAAALTALVALLAAQVARAEPIDEEEAVRTATAAALAPPVASPPAPAAPMLAPRDLAPAPPATATIAPSAAESGWTPRVTHDHGRLTFALPERLKLSVEAFVQADAIAWDESSADAVDPSTGAPLNDTRFLIRRARLRTILERDFVSGSFELDGNTVSGPQARLLSADVTVRWPWSDGPVPLIAATLGLVKVPFGAAVPEKVWGRLFTESPTFARAAFPGEYDLGIVLFGGWEFVRYRLAAMNGDPVGEARFGGRDVDAHKDLVGRLGVDLEVLGGVRVEAGASALFGSGLDPGTPSTKDELVWRDVNENGLVELTELQVVPGGAATPPSAFDRFALGADARVTLTPSWGQVVVFGEVMWAGNVDRGLYVADPVGLGRDLRELGWAVGAWVGLGEHLRAGARYDAYDPDADATDERGGLRVPSDATRSTLEVVIEGRALSIAVLSVAFQHHDNALGRAADGAPARLPDDALMVRAGVGL